MYLYSLNLNRQSKLHPDVLTILRKACSNMPLFARPVLVSTKSSNAIFLAFQQTINGSN